MDFFVGTFVTTAIIWGMLMVSVLLSHDSTTIATVPPPTHTPPNTPYVSEAEAALRWNEIMGTASDSYCFIDFALCIAFVERDDYERMVNCMVHASQNYKREEWGKNSVERDDYRDEYQEWSQVYVVHCTSDLKPTCVAQLLTTLIDAYERRSGVRDNA